jgi:3'-phosphoadenosine 5'-phosphosulfate sulfotransferase (PAPS reductase)/FAD synthetase
MSRCRSGSRSRRPSIPRSRSRNEGQTAHSEGMAARICGTMIFLAQTELFPTPEIVAPILPKQEAPDLSSYDHFLVMFSGGKDSVALVLHLIEQGVRREAIELWHHEVDGREETKHFMDWPSTPAYCRAFAAAMGMPLYFSWREGGFRREMLRNGNPTAQTHFEIPGGEIRTAGGAGKPGTRLKFPQVSPSLSCRWCSAYLKVDVATIALRNQTRFNGKRTLILTGERAQESAARAKYEVFEPDRTDARDGDSKRHVDHWRPIHKWTEEQVWGIIERHRITPHPAYVIGWGRLSCMKCIFGNSNQWATALQIDPESVHEIADYENTFGLTIDRKLGVLEKAAKGTCYEAAKDAVAVAAAMNPNWNEAIFTDHWKLPAGAFGESNGPT